MVSLEPCRRLVEPLGKSRAWRIEGRVAGVNSAGITWLLRTLA